MCIGVEHLRPGKREVIRWAIAQDIHHGTWPLTANEWRTLLAVKGFEIAYQVTVTMQLLEPKRVIEDEGVAGALHFAWNLMLNSTARQRFLSIKNVFYEYQDYLQEIILIGLKYQDIAFFFPVKYKTY